ncbi:MAG: alpha/beta fold hydrolase [Parachlamydiales bacterium]|jgi:hypothetical protein
MRQNLPFDPLFLFSTPLQQTFLGTFLYVPKDPPSQTKYLPLKDGDVLALEVSTPPQWQKTDLTVVMLHGLCGSHRSTLMVRMAKKLFQEKVRTVRVNLRGSGSGRGMAKKFYHSGLTEDIFEVLRSVKKETPLSPVVLVGYSLSGNLVLKLVGEMGFEAKAFVSKVISLSPPLNLKESARRFESPENYLYLHYFTSLLKEELKYLKAHVPAFCSLKWPKDLNFTQFNELFIVPQFGFQNLDDYYQKSSAKPLVSKIEVEARILFCHDDPLVSSHELDGLALPDNIAIYYTEKGGHLGYVTSPLHEHGFYWLDGLLLKWILGKDDVVNQPRF